MKHARVAFAGAVHHATAHPQGLQLADGRVLVEDEVLWLPPVEPGTIIALGIKYTDHAKELAKELTINAKDEPLAFLKGPNALVGHRGVSRRPADATFMHYESELAVVIGRAAKDVKAADAMQHLAGYTVANDYAVRDYLENWYRPNLRVKNRDGCTALGSWLVDAQDVADPHALGLRTFVNDDCKQQAPLIYRAVLGVDLRRQTAAKKLGARHRARLRRFPHALSICEISTQIQRAAGANLHLVVRSIKANTYQTTPRSNLFQRNTTGAALISAMPLRMRCFSSSFEVTRMCRRKVRAIFEKAHSIKLSQEPCLGV